MASDPFLDLVVLGDVIGEESVFVRLGRGDGTFLPVTVHDVENPDLGGGVQSFVVGDVDGNGFSDVVTDTGIVLLADQQATTGPLIRLEMPGFEQPFRGDSMALADVNGDGNVDLAMAGNSDDAVAILRGNGDGTFGDRTDLSVVSPDSVAFADLNRDGAPDLVVGSGSSLVVLLGAGDGTFGAETLYDLSAVEFVLEDLDGDEDVDIVGASPFSGLAHPRRNRTIRDNNGP